MIEIAGGIILAVLFFVFLSCSRYWQAQFEEKPPICLPAALKVHSS
jgi:hypothetical protein